ncbi:glycosyltransferase [Sporomusa sp. KB1]|jgi:glycosyltransferase involved in cell wall biosynthesis|uniref:glycosyltransferase n=1 Tax=Sporomusa sp. KB1 TaxID=943346 RepID=UPI00119E0CAD|nr:glycosyltransferase [Sporomusa sp. KB1]TWH47685.1 glycosyltransferase involved in cell wall biosynthesis [Sporomusa sp. KB1]
MNICFITHNLPFGTYEAFIIPEIKYIINSGHSVTVVPFRPEGEVVHQDSEFLVEHAIKLPLLNSRIIVGAIQEVFRNPIAVAKSLIPIRKSKNLSIFIKNLAVVPKALWLAGYLRSTGVPDHIHVHWINASATMALITAAILEIPWSITAHRGDIAVNNLIREKIRSCSFVRCINENGANEIRRLVEEWEKIHVIHMGVELPNETEIQPTIWKAGNRNFRILMPANFVEVKGHIYLVQAIQQLRSQGVAVQVDLAGEGKLKEQIQVQVREAGLTDCIDFLGQISHSVLLESLFSGVYACVVLPSIVTEKGDKEGIPVSLIEAMAAGVAVVSTVTGGIPELCIEGTALLVPAKDSQALAEALLLIIHDASIRISMIALAKKRVKEQFSIDINGSKLMEVIANY